MSIITIQVKHKVTKELIQKWANDAAQKLNLMLMSGSLEVKSKDPVFDGDRALVLLIGLFRRGEVDVEPTG